MCGEQTQGGNYTMHGVTISELIEKMKLRNTTPEIDTDKIVLTHPDVNRPALQLTGFFDHFDRERVQINRIRGAGIYQYHGQRSEASRCMIS